MQQHKPGYIVILAVMIIAAMTALVTSVINRVMVYTKLQYVLADREQARLLALSGVQIALAQLSAEQAKEINNKKEPEKKAAMNISGPKPEEKAAQFKTVLPLLNKWQQFAFAEDQGGVAGACEIYIAAEQGKINLNALYDFKKKQFVAPDVQKKSAQAGVVAKPQNATSGMQNQVPAIDGLKILQAIGDQLPMKGQIFAEAVGDVFKARGRPLVDVTELLSDKKFQKMRDMLFVTPEKEGKQERLALLDIFTVETNIEPKNGLQPLVISRSLGLVLQLKALDKVDKKNMDKLLEQVKALQVPVAWQQKWDQLLSPVYGKQYSALSNEIKQLFATEFETLTFSVLCYGKFKNTLVKVYAVLARNHADEYCIKKLYWL